MKSSVIVRVSLAAISKELLQSWAKLYCQIWQEPPWNEDFWRPEVVVEDFKQEMSRPDALAFLALNDQRSVIGFTQGYSVSRGELQEIAGNGLLDFLFTENERVYYVDELGVDSSYRGNHLSLRLSRALIDEVRNRSIKSVILRTDVQALAARHVYGELGFNELSIHDAQYPTRTYWSLETDRFVL
jgi:ribosomal protein S18 acetylase RimI-like enzyme